MPIEIYGSLKEREELGVHGHLELVALAIDRPDSQGRAPGLVRLRKLTGHELLDLALALAARLMDELRPLWLVYVRRQELDRAQGQLAVSTSLV